MEFALNMVQKFKLVAMSKEENQEVEKWKKDVSNSSSYVGYRILR